MKNFVELPNENWTTSDLNFFEINYLMSPPTSDVMMIDSNTTPTCNFEYIYTDNLVYLIMDIIQKNNEIIS